VDAFTNDGTVTHMSVITGLINGIQPSCLVVKPR
jgi:hypothetical protein